jgi:hypothetical protein
MCLTTTLLTLPSILTATSSTVAICAANKSITTKNIFFVSTSRNKITCNYTVIVPIFLRRVHICFYHILYLVNVLSRSCHNLN